MSSRSTLRDSTTCAVAGTSAGVELGERVDVREQIAELRAEAVDFVVGQGDSREFGDVADVDRIG